MGKIGKDSGVWDITKVRNKSEVSDEARTKGAKVHSASLMDIQGVALYGALFFFFSKTGRFCCVKWCWLCWFRCLVASSGARTHSLTKAE